ncbi:hypothetical protein Tco_1181390 [Tanacetum coccineum]
MALSKRLSETLFRSIEDVLRMRWRRWGNGKNKEEVVPKVDDVSLVDGVFDGAFDGDGEEDFVMGEGVVVSSSSLVRYGGGEENYGEDDEEHGEGDYLTRMNGIKEVKHESYGRRIQKWVSKMQKH